jgi:hypothetical protein
MDSHTSADIRLGTINAYRHGIRGTVSCISGQVMSADEGHDRLSRVDGMFPSKLRQPSSLLWDISSDMLTKVGSLGLQRMPNMLLY